MMQPEITDPMGLRDRAILETAVLDQARDASKSSI